MRILLLCSSFNGLTQRIWTDLRADGHDVTMQTADSDAAVRGAVAAADPDVVLCPFLKERVPEDVWRSRPTVIIHPGPEGDRGPSSLDWAIREAEPEWGVTALSAIDEMDAGPIWGTRTFRMPVDPPRKSALYAGPVTDAAAALAREVVAKVADPRFVPRPLDYSRPGVHGRLRPTMRQADRAFSWSDPTEHVLRRIRASDGSPGVRTELAGVPVSVFDAHRGTATPGDPGTIALRRQGAVLVRTGDGALWIGHLRRVDADGGPRIKLPATTLLGDRVAGVPEALEPLGHPTAHDRPDAAHHEISYQRHGPVGVVGFDFYNGAMSTAQCQRLAAALRAAAAQDTSVLVLRGGQFFSNGIHLNVIDARPDASTEAWRNINAINDVCREIITCTHQLVVAAVGGNAGAGGVMLGLGADQVLLRDGAVLNPHYRTMGLTGSEYWTYVLPRRVGAAQAERITGECLPIGAAEALAIGLADAVLPAAPDEFDAAVLERAARLATDAGLAQQLAAKAAARAADEQRRPLETYRVRELAEMSRDIFDDRHGFAAARHAFVTKQPSPAAPPARHAAGPGRHAALLTRSAGF
ncbi:hydrogenase maturation protein [Pseudonocardia sp. MH-G8]|uniref:hydrogenase maturation protein n=1 Tax=Pseudonocardia sp. MH-G8 TaxID=1854588 RepID=UPI000BA085E0|nr:hydrogenase maturation protein [Pseudonocardia sp. MH-G8]OZM77605.1 formyl transferase [Pseudonocardia sp. MH-G8]